SGAPLTVLSALTRLDTDPWVEGARLSDLPRDAAARALVPVINMFPHRERSTLDVLNLAERLAALLPHASAPVAGVLAGARGRFAGSPALWFVALGLLFLILRMAACGAFPGH
ncbi:MAG TPA: hypothetical protein VET85_12565, partial [Stellaceae bacterium]|nr:hypothetical protein [Stellaceae bacterium]